MDAAIDVDALCRLLDRQQIWDFNTASAACAKRSAQQVPGADVERHSGDAFEGGAQ
jgi:hypothetical protein